MNSITLLGIIVVVAAVDGYNSDRILMTDISVLTLNAGEYTNARRGSRYPQLKCVGGNAKSDTKNHPKVVQCYNRGDDGYEVHWECKADLPSQCSFGKMSVSCEGYDNSKDPYVLRGSCALEYHLDCKGSGSSRGSYFSKASEMESTAAVGSGFGLLIMVGMLVLIYFCCLSGQNATQSTAMPSATYASPYQAGAPPPPPGFVPNVYPDLNEPNNRPPTYDDTMRHDTRYRGNPGWRWDKTATAAPTTENSGPGFWSGAALGSLAGYMFGNSGSSSSNTHTNTHTVYRSSSPGRSSSPTPSSSHRSASGFATSSRR